MKGELSIFRDRYFWAALLLGGFFLSLTLWFRLTMDQAVFHYVAWVWQKYHLPPYIGAWDLSFPGIFLIHRLVLLVFGKSTFGFRFFDFLVQLGSLAMIFKLGRKIAQSSIAGFISGLCYGIYYFSLGPLESGEREGFVLFFLLAALLVGLPWQERSLWRAVLAGLLAGFVFLLKPTYGLVWPVLALWFLKEGWRKRRGTVWLEPGLFSLSCLLPSLAFIFYYWRLGYLSELYLVTLYFNFKVYSGTAGSFFQAPWSFLLTLANSLFMRQPVILFLGALGILVPVSKCQSGLARTAFWLVFSLAAVSFLSYIIQAKYFPYHLIPFFGAMSIMAGPGSVWLGRQLEEQLDSAGGWVRAWILYSGLIIFMVLNLGPGTVDFAASYCFRSPGKAYLAGDSRDAFYYRAAQTLRPVLADREMEYFGWHPLLPFLLGKKLPSRFCVVYHLLMRPKSGALDPLQRRWMEEYTDAVIDAHPQFFLVSDRVPGWEVFNLPTPSLKQAMRDYFPRLEKFLLANYTLRFRLGEIEVYELNSENSGA